MVGKCFILRPEVLPTKHTKRTKSNQRAMGLGSGKIHFVCFVCFMGHSGLAQFFFRSSAFTSQLRRVPARKTSSRVGWERLSERNRKAPLAVRARSSGSPS